MMSHFSFVDEHMLQDTVSARCVRPCFECGVYCGEASYAIGGVMTSRPLLAQIVWLGLVNVWPISVSSMSARH